jgi:fluoride exporter
MGAILGANARYFLGQYAARLAASSLPYGTLLINLTGSFVLGFFLVWTTDRVVADPRWRWFLAIGFCGSYTTFSSYAYETFALLEQGQWQVSALNILASNVLCLAGVAAGAALARAL